MFISIPISSSDCKKTAIHSLKTANIEFIAILKLSKKVVLFRRGNVFHAVSDVTLGSQFQTENDVTASFKEKVGLCSWF